MIFNALIALCFLAGAPSFKRQPRGLVVRTPFAIGLVIVAATCTPSYRTCPEPRRLEQLTARCWLFPGGGGIDWGR